MVSIAFVDEPASARQRQAVIALCALLLLLALVLTPFSGAQGPELANIGGVYGAAMAAISLSTWLLLSATRGSSRVHSIVSAAYLYGGLMAVLHLLTFPGAVLPGRSIIGEPNAVGWLFICWRAGFPLWILWAVVEQSREGADPKTLPGDRAARVSPALVAVAMTALTYLASNTASMPHYFPTQRGNQFAAISNVAAYGCAVLAAAAIAAIARKRLLDRVLYLWISLMLAADAAGLWMSTYSGGRYTLGWYVSRIEGVLAAVGCLAALSIHMRALQASVARTLGELVLRTDALQAEIQRRERAERMLLQSQKLEAVGQLAAGLAHDLNNLMQVVTARLSLIRRRAGDVVDADVEVIRRNVKRAEGLTRQLMLFSGRRQLQARTVLLQRVLPDLVSMFSSLVRSDVSLELEAPDNVWPVHLDPGELEVTLANLVANARDALPGGGHVRIELRNELTAGADGLAGVALSVRDNGAGIAPEVLERVFEPFFTTKEPGKGTGLGLSQVYAFAKASGGTVTVDSSPGHGTVVTLKFPRAAEGAPEPHALAAAASPGASRGGLVLVVDDHPDVREATALLLQEAGYAVRSAEDAQSALALLQGGLRPDVLLSDIVMAGGMDGVSLGREMRQRFPGVRVVLATGYSNAADRAQSEGFVVLQKPYDSQELAQALERGGTVVSMQAARQVGRAGG
jgi:signal transduction histidine kinase/ActR/RegA family two-component response regulator